MEPTFVWTKFEVWVEIIKKLLEQKINQSKRKYFPQKKEPQK
jgi:hypothetical protein